MDAVNWAFPVPVGLSVMVFNPPARLRRPKVSVRLVLFGAVRVRVAPDIDTTVASPMRFVPVPAVLSIAKVVPGESDSEADDAMLPMLPFSCRVPPLTVVAPL